MNLSVPDGACDTQIHVYDAHRPAAPGTAMPGQFDIGMYREVQKRLGLSRVVVVQANAYRDDNTLALEAARRVGKEARVVAVVQEDVTDRELEALAKGGVVGQRFFNLPGGCVPFSRMDRIAARVHELGWHANLQLDGRELPAYEAQIRRLPGRFVIDHTGKFLEPVAPEHPAFLVLKRLVDTGRCWVKLAGPYETSRSGPPSYEDVGRLARALVAHAPERVIWGSNWPHPSAPAGSVRDEDLLALLFDWAPGEAVRRRILVDNPAELYGFAT